MSSPRSHTGTPPPEPERHDPRGSVDALRAYWSGTDQLWDLATGEGPAAGRRTTLDLTQIVRVAIEIADAQGMDAVSMRKVAAELGTGPMSLYRYVPDKDALTLMMVDAVLDTGPLGRSGAPPTPSGDWRADMRAMAEASWTLMRQHPWLPEALLTRPPLTPNGVAGLEYSLSIFDGHDVDIGTRMQFVGSVHFAVLSVALNAAIEDRTRARLQASDEEIRSSAGSVVSRIIETGRFPHVVDFIVNAEHEDDTHHMRTAVELILDGIATRLTTPPKRARAKAAAPAKTVRAKATRPAKRP